MTIKIIPNIITTLNLICGLLAISYSSETYITSCYFVFIACFFDFLDGFVARKLNAETNLGKILDSFSDLISFGVAPTFILFFFLKDINTHHIIYFSSFLITICTAIRLAKFNMSQKKYFVGLPSPVSALFICSICMMDVQAYQNIEYYMILLIFIISFLMISNTKMFKIKNNFTSIIFLLISSIIIVFLKELGLTITLFLYIAISIIKFKYEIQS